MHPASTASIGTEAPSTAPLMKATVIQAPGWPDHMVKPLIFLAGTTTPTADGDWRQKLVNRLSQDPVTFLDPTNKNWDSTWTEDFSDTRWTRQIRWELDLQEQADIVVVFFHESTLAPVSLLELGMHARSGKAIACAMPGYAKRGNVQAACGMYDGEFVTSEEELAQAVKSRLRDRFKLGNIEATAGLRGD
ncbi:hypothetical protein MGU_00782 [Metarhizium guizhouense ARSEF 977]|uniref:Nucleoside 2-deoxyribosyltransferase n=1 Tax=Metarhizium guizhouense (strain ARSEF 977) TaxID=1276136 RepID=A0A0B4HCM2_METGA|nr:hypothetical protein MGU_00782 [Metarhizium guizhouense ARSEF 977]